MTDEDLRGAMDRIRRKFENEANQAYAEQLLLRNECIRLRDVVCTLSTFIEESHANGDEEIPEGIRIAIDSVFPPEARTDTERLDKLQTLTDEEGDDVVIESDGTLWTVSGIESGRGPTLRAALDDLLRQERGGEVVVDADGDPDRRRFDAWLRGGPSTTPEQTAC